jgi:tetratricopeptide (TPR) repeat protein
MVDVSKQKKELWWHLSLMMVATVLAYTQVFHAGFMSWDDMDYVFHTRDIQGVGWEQISHWFSTNYIGNYQPLPIFTYALDYALGGQQPLVYHLDSLVCHIACVFMLYTFLNRFQGNNRVALCVALLFALHPTQTESVSWIAARNKVMFGFFFFWSLVLYIDYVKTLKPLTLLWVCLTGFAAYLCKATAVALPLAMFAVDIILQRPLANKKLWLEKLPLVFLAIPIAIVTLHAQKEIKFLEAHQEFQWYHTLVFAGYAYVQYILQLLLPIKLSVLYPYPKEIGLIHILYAVIALGMVGLMYVSYKKKWWMLCGGLLFYTVNILPVLQFVQFGEELMADRYLYVASVGIWLPMVYYLFVYLQAKTQYATIICSVVAGVLLLMTYSRNNIWLSEENFWEAILDKFPNSSVAQNSMGGVYIKSGNYPTAMQYVDKAIEIDPNNYKAWYNKGVISMRQLQVEPAIMALNKCIAINPYSKALFTRAMIEEQTHNPEPALADINKVLEQQPDYARAYYIKGSCLEQQNKLSEAMQYYNSAILYDDREPVFYMHKGIVNIKTRKNNEAIADLDKAITLQSRMGEAYYWRGVAKANLKQNPCNDLNVAMHNGYKQAAEEAYIKLCNTH